jgi:hypothetical protein
MILNRYYPGLGFLSGICCTLFVAGVVVLVAWRDIQPRQAITLGTICTGMAVLGGTLSVKKTVLELGFHLEEKVREAGTPPSRRDGV